MKTLSGWTRLGIVAVILAVLSQVLPLLKIHRFTPFNSGVSVVIALLALGWLGYTVFVWVAAGFERSGGRRSNGGDDPAA